VIALDITISLDGYVAGPNPSLDEPLGAGGMQLHEWLFAAASWREQHGKDGGERTVDSELYDEMTSASGAAIMGRKMFSGGEGPWEADPMAGGWWGDDPPFGYDVFVLTHHAREPLVQGGTTFTFVTDGIESALAEARAVAGERNVAIAGGASTAQQFLRAGFVDQLQLHVAPVLLGAGLPLFAGVGPLQLELTRAVGSTRAGHVRYRVTH
jgi:dihydrofolate reductase